VTLDIQMPGMTGVDVVRELLANETWPVIMISSLAPDEGSMVFDALNAGAFDYLQKPRLEESQDFQEQLIEKLLLAVQSENIGKTKPLRPVLK
jgi:two-component system chemotaxis response regulator CheB